MLSKVTCLTAVLCVVAGCDPYPAWYVYHPDTPDECKASIQLMAGKWNGIGAGITAEESVDSEVIRGRVVIRYDGDDPGCTRRYADRGKPSDGVTSRTKGIGGRIVKASIVLCSCDPHVVGHEIGHSLGLEHSDDPDSIMSLHMDGMEVGW